MTALSIIQTTCVEIGLPSPTSALSSTDPQIMQLVRLLNKEGKELSSRYAWQVLRREANFVTVASELQGTIDTIVGVGQTWRYIINDTIWNRTRSWPVLGPISSRHWQANKALAVSGPISTYRIDFNYLRFFPAPAAGEDCAFEFITRNWCSDSLGATYKQAFTVDSDVAILDEDIMQQGLLWRWRAAKKLDYTEDFITYERMVADAMARDGTKPILSMCGPVYDMRPFIMVPNGNWNM